VLGPTRRLAVANARKAEAEATRAEIALRTQVAEIRDKLNDLPPRVAHRIERSPDVLNAVERLRENPLQPISIDIRPQPADRF
jgi:hypothetical protein